MVLHWLFSCYRQVEKKLRIHGFSSHRITTSSSKPPSPPQPESSSVVYPMVTKCSCVGREEQTVLLCDIQGTLVRSQTLFPYFMLVAFEGGSIIRAFFLLLLYPLLLLLNININGNLGIKLMTFITFCGLRAKDMEVVARAVLPKFFLEDLNVYSYRVMKSTGRRAVLTSMPRVMVESFLRNYLSVDLVVGSELQVFGKGKFFSGLLVSSELSNGGCGRDFKPSEIVLCNSSSSGSSRLVHDRRIFLSLCKEVYVVSEESARKVMTRENYPKPLVFHDGRLAFFPTPAAAMGLFMWIPLGVMLAFARTVVGTCVPYNLGNLLSAWSGFTIRVKGLRNLDRQEDSVDCRRRGVLYVCSHRTLMDPVVVSTALQRPITAVTYSLSLMSELISPIRTVRLTRDRERDRKTMERQLEEGDLVVCPEGTTCREPYLLRFSPLFAELTDEIVPVAVDVKVSMFYGTTATGYKWLDPIFLLMNPNPIYSVEFLPKLTKDLTSSAGFRSCEVANRVQKLVGEALGFQCTSLTRRDKYMMLAGNEGVLLNNGL